MLRDRIQNKNIIFFDISNPDTFWGKGNIYVIYLVLFTKISVELSFSNADLEALIVTFWTVFVYRT